MVNAWGRVCSTCTYITFFFFFNPRSHKGEQFVLSFTKCWDTSCETAHFLSELNYKKLTGLLLSSTTKFFYGWSGFKCLRSLGFHLGRLQVKHYEYWAETIWEKTAVVLRSLKSKHADPVWQHCLLLRRHCRPAYAHAGWTHTHTTFVNLYAHG